MKLTLQERRFYARQAFVYVERVVPELMDIAINTFASKPFSNEAALELYATLRSLEALQRTAELDASIIAPEEEDAVQE